jgi:osmotically-inducible protein OsmY
MPFTKNTQSAHTLESLPSELATIVATRLRRSGYPYLRGIHCEQQDEAITLKGTVPTFHLKQVAQALALHTPGVRSVVDLLHVTGREGLAR